MMDGYARFNAQVPRSLLQQFHVACESREDVALLTISILLFISGDWVHQKPQMKDSSQQLEGMEGLYAQATHDGMQLFMLACLMVVIVKLILAYIQGVILGNGGDSSSKKELDNGVRSNGVPLVGYKSDEDKECDQQ